MFFKKKLIKFYHCYNNNKNSWNVIQDAFWKLNSSKRKHAYILTWINYRTEWNKRSVNLYNFIFQFAYIWHWWPGIKVLDEFLIRHLGKPANTLGLMCVKNCFSFKRKWNWRKDISIWYQRKDIYSISCKKFLSKVWFARLCDYLKNLLLYFWFNSDMFSSMQTNEFKLIFYQRFSILFPQRH